METDVDAYFAKHDIPSVVSDMLFELGFHRPKDAGKFMAAYVEKRFRLGLIGDTSAEKRGVGAGIPIDNDFSTIEVHTADSHNQLSADDGLACMLLEEAQGLRKKYKDFLPHPIDGQGSAKSSAAQADAASFAIIPWHEFRLDYERLLLIFQSPQLWSFCERRLAQLRGLFDAHCALNAGPEETEILASPPAARVDNCVQLSRSLAPSRLREFFRQKATSSDASVVEVAPGKTLSSILGQLGRQPTPADLTADADLPLSAATELAGVFSRTSNHMRGQFLAEALCTGFKFLEATDEAAGGEMYAEYRLPLHAEMGAWMDLARWISEFNVSSPRVRWVMQLPQAAYSGLKASRLVLSFGEFLDNAFGPPAAAAAAAQQQDESSIEAEQLAKLIQVVSGFELASSAGAAEELGPDLDREPRDWTTTANPPYAYQLYHMWARLKALNACRQATELPPVGLRSAASTAEPLACAYLLGADGASRCAVLAAHAPLQYLFALEADSLVVSLSLASRRSVGDAGEAGAQTLSKLFRAGVAVALCTEDPTMSHQSDNPLDVEYGLARSMLNLKEADLAEMARHSVKVSGFPALRPAKQAEDAKDTAGDSGIAADEASSKESRPKSIRERYRDGRREAEEWLIRRSAQLALHRQHSEGLDEAGSLD